MSIELEELDCNCNNCAYLVRDNEKLKQSQERHLKWQQDHFNTIKNNFLEKAAKDENIKDYRKADNFRKEASKMKFQFDKKEASINYGDCSKFNKEVSFIPNVLQLETQECFKHRRK